MTQNRIHRTLSVAPMMGYSDRHFRYLTRLISPNAVLYTEMVVTGALLHGDSARFLIHSKDAPCAMQLGGSDPADLARAAIMVEQAGYQEVNLNVGCPSDRVQQGGIGACLMAEAELVADCYRAMTSAVSIPVTIKCRIGIDDQDSFEFFDHFVSTLIEAGCGVFLVHARKAILKGLSPKENREIPPLHYNYVNQISALYPTTSFTLNGGITDLDQAISLLQVHSNLMLGRIAYQNPYMLAELEQAVFATPLPRRQDIVAAYLQYIDREMIAGEPLRHMARHLLGLYAGLPGARAFRRHLSTQMNKPAADVSVIHSALKELRMD